MAAFMNIKSIDLANALLSVFDPTELRSYQSFTIFLPKSNNKMSDKPVTLLHIHFEILVHELHSSNNNISSLYLDLNLTAM